MRLRLSNPELLPELVEFLESRADMVTARMGEDEIEVSLLGSYGIEQAWLTLDLLVRAWEAGRSADASVECSARGGATGKSLRVPRSIADTTRLALGSSASGGGTWSNSLVLVTRAFRTLSMMSAFGFCRSPTKGHSCIAATAS
jgi:hypothetical protein